MRRSLPQANAMFIAKVVKALAQMSIAIEFVKFAVWLFRKLGLL
jgi:flagellar biogenesis protein FliO